ncbi:hypothetical protein IEO21_07879 [Rhodonia placenta]|uniref:Uncharacterized protein n=1 Tax=Rhodonia placenta TaxID=104341 RepID=A0A8H7TZC4_9APHY|nr:hypothetical protein IEO21_07879 [Postia placenta]
MHTRRRTRYSISH